MVVGGRKAVEAIMFFSLFFICTLCVSTLNSSLLLVEKQRDESYQSSEDSLLGIIYLFIFAPSSGIAFVEGKLLFTTLTKSCQTARLNGLV